MAMLKTVEEDCEAINSALLKNCRQIMAAAQVTLIWG
jgi:hypothetical protein